MLNGFNKENFSFPFSNAHGREFLNRDSLLSSIVDEFGDDPSQGLYLSTLHTAPLNLIYDQWTQDQINKYFYCKEFNTSPFEGAYDDLPANWLDFVNIIQGEIPEIQKEVNRRGNK